ILKPVSAQGLDETSADASMAIDGSSRTAWKTQFYRGNPVFGGLKTGSGLLLDMGKQVRLSSVKVLLGPTAGASVSIAVGNDGSTAQKSDANFTTVASAGNLPGGGPAAPIPGRDFQHHHAGLGLTERRPEQASQDEPGSRRRAAAAPGRGEDGDGTARGGRHPD